MIPKDGDLIQSEVSPEGEYEVWPRTQRINLDAEGFDCEDPSICE